MKQYYDLTFPFCPEMFYPKSIGPFKTEKYMTHAVHGHQVQLFTDSTHTGTHIDAPFHFYANGKTLSDIPLDRYFGRAVVLDVPKRSYELVTIQDVENSGLNILENDMVFFNTHRGLFWDQHDQMSEFASISEELACWLVKKKINMVGIDASSVDIANSQRTKSFNSPIHTAFLSNDILILECLDLTKIPAGYYRASCLPMALKDSDGAPVRVVCETIE